MTAADTDWDDDALITQGEAVVSRQDFVRFLSAFANDAEANGHLWENPSPASFFDALAAWAEDCPGYYSNMDISVNPDEPQWRVFADMLLAARVYE